MQHLADSTSGYPSHFALACTANSRGDEGDESNEGGEGHESDEGEVSII